MNLCLHSMWKSCKVHIPASVYLIYILCLQAILYVLGDLCTDPDLHCVRGCLWHCSNWSFRDRDQKDCKLANTGTCMLLMFTKLLNLRNASWLTTSYYRLIEQSTCSCLTYMEYAFSLTGIKTKFGL